MEVVLSAHLDSGFGDRRDADNGTARWPCWRQRALQKLGVKPANDPVCAVPGEESRFGGSGAEGASERTGKISGVLVHDSGTGKVLTVGLMETRAAQERSTTPYLWAGAKEVGLAEPTLRRKGARSCRLMRPGAGFWCVQDPGLRQRRTILGRHHRARALGRF
jgi:hypothetical protein